MEPDVKQFYRFLTFFFNIFLSVVDMPGNCLLSGLQIVLLQALYNGQVLLVDRLLPIRTAGGILPVPADHSFQHGQQVLKGTVAGQSVQILVKGLAGGGDILHPFGLPDGYHTMVTGDGANLSQGQRQLLAIARAAVADPPVMILDEATSSIDTRTERHIEQGMDALMEGRTVFVIAHRLSTVRNSNCIVVIEHGQIQEKGSHQELLAQKGRYYQLYTGQFQLS